MSRRSNYYLRLNNWTSECAQWIANIIQKHICQIANVSDGGLSVVVVSFRVIRNLLDSYCFYLKLYFTALLNKQQCQWNERVICPQPVPNLYEVFSHFYTSSICLCIRSVWEKYISISTKRIYKTNSWFNFIIFRQILKFIFRFFWSYWSSLKFNRLKG